MTTSRSSSPTTDRSLAMIDTLDDLCEVVAGDVFVRFSKGPDDDRGKVSHDYESGLDLPGLSVNPLNPEPWWTRPVKDWLARQVCNYVHLKEESDDGRRAWILRGDVVARGPDNEPIVADHEPVALLSERLVAEAKRLYAERFDVAEDST